MASCFFEPPTGTSLTDTLYISMVIKEVAKTITDNQEKVDALNTLMEKNQLKGGCEKLKLDMASVTGARLQRGKEKQMMAITSLP